MSIGNKFVKLLFAFFTGLLILPTTGNAQPGTWAVSFGGDLQDYAEDILVDDAGNAYISGFYRDSLIFPGGPSFFARGKSDVFLAKYDNSGQLAWAKTYGWYANEFAHGLAMSPDGNVIMVGQYQDSTIFEGDSLFSFDSLYWGPPNIAPALTYDIFILEVDPNGNMQSLWGGGWFSSEDFYEVEFDTEGNMVFTGVWRGFNRFAQNGWGKGYDEAMLCIMDTALQNSYTVVQEDTIWKWYESFSHKATAFGRFFDRGEVLGTIGDSVYLMGGTFQDTCWFRDSTIYEITDFEDDVFITAYDDTLGFRWVATAGGPGKDEIEALVTDAAGNIYIGGHFDQTMSLGTNNLTSMGKLDGYIAKMDQSGNFTWVKNLGGPWFDSVKDMEVKANGNILVTGYFQGEFNYGSTQMTAMDSLDQQMFVIEIDAAGNIVWARQGGGASLDQGVTVDSDANGYVYVYGTFNETAYFGQASVTSTGSDDLFVVRIAPDGSVSSEPGQQAAIPNLAPSRILRLRK